MKGIKYFLRSISKNYGWILSSEKNLYGYRLYTIKGAYPFRGKIVSKINNEVREGSVDRMRVFITDTELWKEIFKKKNQDYKW